jgi:hypothetical protein
MEENDGGAMAIHQQQTVRFTFDMPVGLHHHLKVICAKDRVPMNAFVTKAIEQEFAARDDRLDEEAYDAGMRDVAKNGTISLEEMDKAMEG